MISTDSQNLATQSRWLAIMPINQIFPAQKKALSLNLTKFTVPEVQIGSTEVAYLGNTIQIPTKVIQPQSKEIQFDYLVSSDFYQYKMLHKWVQFVANNKTIDISPEVISQSNVLASYLLPVTITLLSEFKKPIMSIKYNNCWIKEFGPLSLDYQSNDEPVMHNFTLAYGDFDFIDVTDPGVHI